MGKFDGMDPQLVRELLAEVKQAATQLRATEARVVQVMTRAGLATQTTHRPVQVAEAADTMVKDVNDRLGLLEKKADRPRGDSAPTVGGDGKPADEPKEPRDDRSRDDNPRSDTTKPAEDAPKTRDDGKPSEDAKTGDQARRSDDVPKTGDDAKPDKPSEDAKTGDEARRSDDVPKTGDDAKPDKPSEDAKTGDEARRSGDVPKTGDDAKPDKPSEDAKTGDEARRSDDVPKTGDDGKPSEDGSKACDDAKPDKPSEDARTGDEARRSDDVPKTGDDTAVGDEPKDDDRDSRRDRGAEADGQRVDTPAKDHPDDSDPHRPQVIEVDGVKVLQVPIDPPTAEQLRELLENIDNVQPIDMPSPGGDGQPADATNGTGTPDVGKWANDGDDVVSAEARPLDMDGLKTVVDHARDIQPLDLPGVEVPPGEYGRGEWAAREIRPDGPAGTIAPGTPVDTSPASLTDTPTGVTAATDPSGGTTATADPGDSAPAADTSGGNGCAPADPTPDRDSPADARADRDTGVQPDRDANGGGVPDARVDRDAGVQPDRGADADGGGVPERGSDGGGGTEQGEPVVIDPTPPAGTGDTPVAGGERAGQGDGDGRGAGVESDATRWADDGSDVVSAEATPLDLDGLRTLMAHARDVEPLDLPGVEVPAGEYGRGEWAPRHVVPDGPPGAVDPGPRERSE
ncbi:hypothetical protein [Nonomuraea cavernae]|uniref:Uncharacterized protein n=1 Tax=Nonomuraea cavernae TaxID=2045107 RepID=A0A917Z3U9_9ACTN|nr:hypothetical protein [Nonomuraea cavernae]MCA2188305.1 hypothetical protein [Nonomuraea cavernae]GGO73700.1 hypothetical protein GCM10012289_44640 [Nonomuraea cavernae]